MDRLKIYQRDDVNALRNERSGEEKLGDHVQVVKSLEALKESFAQFVIIGIPEDIGVRANEGIGGTKTAWQLALKAFLNMQSNVFLHGEEMILLGHFEIEEPAGQTIAELRQKTMSIDALVAPVIEQIIAANKIPIVIGGGHNNAFPIVAGFSRALGGKKVNVVNIDAHADLRNPAEGRHSGNGFSTAIAHGYLNEYRVFGLHQSYTHQDLPGQMMLDSTLRAFYFEDLISSTLNIKDNWINFIADLKSPCGLEIDLDSMANILSSATSPSGFNLNDIRAILLNNEKIFRYLHICEGAAALADGRTNQTIGKTIAYLISDFIKALRPHICLRP